MSSTTLKQIAISRENYLALKKMGGAGDSFNDVISRLLKISATAADLPIIQPKEEEKR
jgi:predicted CopG family antitoxin